MEQEGQGTTVLGQFVCGAVLLLPDVGESCAGIPQLCGQGSLERETQLSPSSPWELLCPELTSDGLCLLPHAQPHLLPVGQGCKLLLLFLLLLPAALLLPLRLLPLLPLGLLGTLLLQPFGLHLLRQGPWHLGAVSTSH